MYDRIHTPTRRTVMKSFAATAAASVLAGCLDGTGAADGDGRNPDESYVDSEPKYDGWLSEANGHHGTVDPRSQDEVVVEVGAGRQGMAFAPAAVVVSPGTAIRWEWTGDGGTHNVRHENGLFESEYASSTGHVFEHSFSDEGIYKYVCEPHRSMGMVGAITVNDPVDTE